MRKLSDAITPTVYASSKYISAVLVISYITYSAALAINKAPIKMSIMHTSNSFMIGSYGS